MANAELEGKLNELTGDLRNLANKETSEARSRSAAVTATRDNILQKTVRRCVFVCCVKSLVNVPFRLRSAMS